MYSFRKSKKGFTLIELMVVVAIIGVLALLGLRLYTGQQEKAKNAIIKANAGTIQTLIQAELADSSSTSVRDLWTGGTMVIKSGIHNPVSGSAQTTYPVSLATAADGEVWVGYDISDEHFDINGNDAKIQDLGNGTNVYTTSLTARR